SGPRWPGRSSSQRCTGPSRSTGHSGRPPRRGGSPTATSPRSSPIRPPPRPGMPQGPARPAPWPRAPAPGRPAAAVRRPASDRPGEEEAGRRHRRPDQGRGRPHPPGARRLLRRHRPGRLRRPRRPGRPAGSGPGRAGRPTPPEPGPGGRVAGDRPHRLPPPRREEAVTAAAPAPPPLDDGLDQLLRRMRLPHMRRIAPEVIATAKAQRWDPAEVLRALLTEEVAGRDRSSLATRRARAAFPSGKTFDAWDERLSSVPAPTQAALRTLEWIARRENLVVCGPSGTGKTFLLEALGQAAIAAGKNVAWSTLEQVGALVRRHRADDSVTKAIARILRADLVVIDDIGLLPVAPDAAEGLYRIVDAAYERRSVAVSSNLHPSGFDELMPKTLATATVDRLMHHAHVCQTSGDSIRLTQAIAGKGVIPLS